MAGESSLVLMNADNGRQVAARLRVADSFWSRFAGLMGKSGLPEGEGLLLRRCPSIHTCFMRFAIDVAYLDRDMRIVAVFHAVKPWRFVPGVRSGVHGLELPAGVLRKTETSVGHRLEMLAP